MSREEIPISTVKVEVTKSLVLTLVMTVFLGISLATFLTGIGNVFSGDYELILGEGFLWWQADTISNGEAIFRPLSTDWFQSIPHTPLYTLVCGFLSRIFGSTIVIGRVVSLVSGLISVVLIFGIVKHITKSAYAAFIGSFMIFTLQVFRFLAPIYRMDMFAITIAILGVFLFLKLENRGKLVYLSIPVLILSLYGKQSLIAAPIAICLYLFFIIDKRKAFKYGGIFLGSYGVTLLIAGAVTGWELLIQNYIHIMFGSGLTWHHFSNVMESLLFYHFPILLLVGIYFIWKLIKRIKLNLLDIYFLVSFTLVVLTIGKFGSSFHYGLEALMLACALVGLFLKPVLRVFEERSKETWVLMGVSAIVVLIVLQSIGFPLGQGYTSYSYTETTAEANEEVVDYIKNATGPVFSHLHAYPMQAEAEGYNITWDPIDPAAVFIPNLKDQIYFGWDISGLVERMDSQYYELVILPYDFIWFWAHSEDTPEYKVARWRMPEEVAYAFRTNYKLEHVTEYLGTLGRRFKVYVWVRR